MDEGKYHNNIELLIKLLFKYLADPFFIAFDNSVIAKALSMLINEQEAKQKSPNGSVAIVLSHLKQKQQKPVGLQVRDMNIHNA